MLRSLSCSLLALLLTTSCQRSTASTPAPHEPAEDSARAEGHGPQSHAASTPNAAHDGHHHHRHHRFEDAEQWAKMFDDPARDQWQRPEAVIDALALAPDATVADLGAGTGYFSVRFARRVPQGRVIASDIEPDMVRYLTQRATKEGLSNMVAVEGSPDDPRLPEAVDVAFMCNVYHHIEDREAFFGHVLERLRPGGRVVIVDFKKDAPDDVPGPPPEMRVAQEELVAQLAPMGLVVVGADRQLLPYQYVVELKPAAR